MNISIVITFDDDILFTQMCGWPGKRDFTLLVPFDT